MFKGSGLKVLKVELCGFIKIIFLEIFFGISECVGGVPHMYTPDAN